jgi:hypothetical protein
LGGIEDGPAAPADIVRQEDDMRTTARAGTAAALVVAGAGLAGAETAAPELSLRYSAVVVPFEGAVQGWQASVATRPGGGWGWAIDGGGYYAGGGGAHVLMAGPRYSTRPSASGVSFFVHLLAGAAFGGDSALFLAHPGVGVDFGRHHAVGFRVQTDWPLMTAYGAIASAPRVSAGIVLRPGRR